MELLFILNKPLVRLLNCKAVNSHPNFFKNATIFGKYRIFLQRLKTVHKSKHNYVKTFHIRHDAKCYRASLMKMQFFNIITFLNESKFYDEERNELS